MDFREAGWECVIHLALDKDQWRCSCEHGNELSGSIKDREIFE